MLSRASFKAMGTMNTVAVDEPDVLPDALALVQLLIGKVDAVCSRFRADSELSQANQAAGRGPVVMHPLLEEALTAAFRAAEMTGGLVDPTVGKHVEDAGYTVTFTAVPADGPPLEVPVRKLLGWRSVEMDATTHSLTLPLGVALDLGASGKAWAADRAATAVAETFGVAALVECGGDVAVRGRVPGDGWPVRVAPDESASLWQDVLVRDGGLATSGTTARRWRRGGIEVHDIIDPRTGRAAETPWAMVTVAAATCLEANAAATAALILGRDANSWLDACRLPARLVRADGQVELAGGWSA
ncbi:MAG TPA: FAD:protein FMN transferase [Candidatus Limnocylindrales bacterium]|nr:FAD:protein FMN transferase [Candidatus Limnocylindrales bacterium]